MERSHLLELLTEGYPSAWGHKEKIQKTHKEQDTAIENCITKEKKITNYSFLFKMPFEKVYVNMAIF
jgi:hypothetical protein